MSLTQEQIKTLKAQLSEQIQHLPEEQKSEAQKQIEDMSPESLETMLKQQQAQQQPIFRSIISGEIPSKKLDETSEAIAVLSVKATSDGHTLIIPKTAIKNQNKIPKNILKFAEKIAKKIKAKLKAKDAQIFPEQAFGETILNVIPIYAQPLTLESPRQEVSPEDLEKLFKKLKIITKPKLIKLSRKPKSTSIKLKRRIP